MSLDVGTVIAVLRTLLDEVRNAAVAATVDIPERQYVTTGGAVYDCAQVSVSANSITTGPAGATDAGQGVTNCAPGWNVSVELAVVRCVAEGVQGYRGTEAPAVTDIELDTSAASADAAILTQAVEAIAGPGWDQLGVVPASIQFGEVAGGLSAVVLSVTLNLWDIPDGPLV